MKIQLASVIHDSIVDGEGIRSVVFVQGCPHHCPGCHNPKSIPFEGGMSLEVDDVIADILKANLGKVTFSGGEPFAQAEALYYIAKELKKHGYNIWSYSGYTFEALMRHQDPYKQKLLSQLDILVDGPFLLQQRSIKALFRGSTNQRILDIPKSLKQNQAVLAKKFVDWEKKQEEKDQNKDTDIFI